MKKLIQFVKDAYLEITQRVSWPTVAQLQVSATVVLVVSLLFALVIGGIDAVFKNGMLLVYESF